MRLLFDQNLSHRLVSLLAAEFPGSQHVRDAVPQQDAKSVSSERTCDATGQLSALRARGDRPRRIGWHSASVSILRGDVFHARAAR
jgi:hypothetical protein